jgi:PST family polysaccharide transporter
LNDLVKISSWTGIATSIKIAAQFVTAKILAVFIGPAGLAILGQLYNVGNIIQSVSTGGITLGVTKYVAEYSNDQIQLGKIIKSAFKVTLYCSVITSVIVLLGFRWIGEYVFKTNEYNSVIFALGLTIVLFSFNSVIIAIINGLKNYRLYIIINICTSLLNLLLTIVFVRFFGVYGALLSFVLSPSLLFFISYFIASRQQWMSGKFLNLSLESSILKKFGNFSLIALNNAIVGSVAQIAIRWLIINNLTLPLAGNWDAMNRLSNAYLVLLTTSIQVYYLPTLSSIKEGKLLWREIIRSEKIILPLVSLMFIILFIFRSSVIDLLFTKEFAIMKEVIIFQLIGDLIKVGSWVLSYTMYAKAMTKQLIITDNAFTVLYLALSYFLIRNFGFESVYYAYIINNLVYGCFIYFFLKWYVLKRQDG